MRVYYVLCVSESEPDLYLAFHDLETIMFWIQINPEAHFTVSTKPINIPASEYEVVYEESVN